MNLPIWNIVLIMALIVALVTPIGLLHKKREELELRLKYANREIDDLCYSNEGLMDIVGRWQRLFGSRPGCYEKIYTGNDDNEKTVAIDLDGVILEYVDPWNGVAHFGDPIPGAAEAIEKIRKLGCKVAIYTTRNNPMAQCNLGWDAMTLTNMVREQLDKHGIQYDSLEMFKPLAAYYIDDRAIRFYDWKQALWAFASMETKRADKNSDEIWAAIKEDGK